MAQHQAKLEETIEQTKALQKAMKAGKVAANQIQAANHIAASKVFLSNAHLGSRFSVGGKGGKKPHVSFSISINF